VEEAIQEVRTLSYLLHPPLLEEMGLQSAIQWYLDGFAERSNLELSFDHDLGFPRLSREVELAMFRVLQEALTNVHRHAGAKTAQVRLFKQGENAILEVKDDGQGMDPALFSRGRPRTMALGIGLRGMIERMHQLQGELEVFSTPQGTTVIAKAPLNRGAGKLL
jgi:signal transduction histidine kinase